MPNAAQTCRVCLGETSSQSLAAREMMFGLRKSFRFCTCHDCGSLSLSNPPQDLSRYYPRAYYSISSHEKKTTRSLTYLSAYKLISSLPPRLVDQLSFHFRIRPDYARHLAGLGIGRTSSIADVGSGQGELLVRMARSGFRNLVGIDPYIGRASIRGPVRLFEGSLEDLGSTFDLIMFNHSLEHMPDPRTELKVARRFLNPEGRLMVRLPVLGFAWEKYRENWVGLDPPRHMFVPTVEGFLSMANSLGFRVERTFFDSQALQFLGSERYLRDIPLVGPVPQGIKRREMRKVRSWERQARSLNRARRGDAAGFLLVPY